jgi:hypothetical protein
VGSAFGGSDVLVFFSVVAHIRREDAEAEQGMRGRRPTFGNWDAQGQQRAVQVAVLRRRRLAVMQPPEPVASPDQAPRTDEVRYQAEVARRAKVLEQDPSFRWPGEDEPLMMLSGSPPIPPRTDKAATPSRSSIPDTTPPKLFGDDPDRERRAAIYEQLFGDTGNPTALTPMLAAAPSIALNKEGRGRSSATSVSTLSSPENRRRIVVDTPVGLDAVEPSPAARPEVEPDKRKRAARSPARPRTRQTVRARTRQGATINRVEVIRQTKALIIALEEALDYDQVRDHNQRPPILWSDDPSYLKDVDALVVELRSLNSLLEAKRPRKKEAERAVIDLARHFDKFLHAYASWFGKGTALLTVAVIANLLQHAGLDPTAVCSAIRH